MGAVDEDPEYLKNQSRYLHARFRRKRAMSNALAVIWFVAFMCLFLASVLDRVVHHHWGLADETWIFLGFACCGLLAWCADRVISKFMLKYIQHTYGPDPSELCLPR